MWKPVLVLGILMLAIGDAAFADRTVYTLVMCDTNAEGVEAEARTCGENFLSMIKVFHQRGLPCATPAYIPGERIGLAEIQRCVSAFPIDGNDTLLFYYVGHGESRQGVHILDTSVGKFSRDEIRNTLLSASRVRPKLTLVMTECCAPERAPPKFVPFPIFGLALGEKVPNRNLLENLLLDHAGLVDFNSCSYGERAAVGKDGALFSYILENLIESESSFEAYDANKDGFVSWREFFPRLAEATYERSQKAQRPYAFSLGTAPREVEPDHYAANFGLNFTIVSVNFRKFSARLTRDPEPSTPAGRVGLKAGDILDTLDDQPIWGPIDVYSHHLDTKVEFYRDGRLLTNTAFLPEYTPYPPEVPKELYAQNFAMSFHLIPFGKQFGARLTRMVPPNSPLSFVGLESGDMIVKIDGERINSAQDVANHVQRTEIEYIDVPHWSDEKRLGQPPLTIDNPPP